MQFFQRLLSGLRTAMLPPIPPGPVTPATVEAVSPPRTMPPSTRPTPDATAIPMTT